MQFWDDNAILYTSLKIKERIPLECWSMQFRKQSEKIAVSGFPAKCWRIPLVKNCLNLSETFRKKTIFLNTYLKKIIRRFVLQDEDAINLDFILTLRENDHKFGFSMMGGFDEGFPARIDEVVSGRILFYYRNS